MNNPISTIAPVFISDKFTLNEQISHIRDTISAISGAQFSSTNKSDKSDNYPELIEVFRSLGSIFRVKEKVKLESVFYNLITCCDVIPGPSHSEFFKALCDGFKSESCKEDVVVRLEYLELFFISFPDSDTGKYHILRSYLELSIQHNCYSRISWINLSSLKVWCEQWGLKMEREKYELFLLAKEAIKGAGRAKEVLEILVEMNATFPPINMRELAIELICTVLNKPDEFYLDKYSRLPTIKEEIIKRPDLYQLFQILLTFHYSEYKKFLETHPNTITEFKLNSNILENKIKLLTLVDLGTKSRIVTFEHISRCLDLSKIQVDGLVIEAVRFGLCQAKINVIDEIVEFKHVPARIFNIDQWKYLHARLEQFRNSLTTIPRDLKLS